MVAHITDFRASLASGTVKKRMRICGRPAVPNISAMPKEMAEIGSVMNLPGPMIDCPAAAASSGVVPGVWAAICAFTSTAAAKNRSRLKP